MNKPFLPEITYMRGLCMLGVIGIHVGSYALANPQANIHIIALLEILSRFCVPAFFFLSAFGLFYHTSVDDEFSYKTFIQKRIQVVLYPYLVWSLFYILYNGLGAHTLAGLHPKYLLPTLFFGNGSYHLYFMVILLWFYLLMPLWRSLVRFILKRPLVWLSIIFLLQTAFNFWSSYLTSSLVIDNPALKYAFSMRLNYWVLHYIWIFLLGAVIAERYSTLQQKFWDHRGLITSAFILSVLAMLGSYYYVLDAWQYSRLSAIYTIHQLSPMGMFYTGAGSIYFLFLFMASPMNASNHAFWQKIGDASYGMYLVHPLLLIWFSAFIAYAKLLYTAPVVIVLYCCTAIGAYFATGVLRQLPKKIRRYILGA